MWEIAHLPSTCPVSRISGADPAQAWRPCHSRQVGAAYPCGPLARGPLVAAANLDPHQPAVLWCDPYFNLAPRPPHHQKRPFTLLLLPSRDGKTLHSPARRECEREYGVRAGFLSISSFWLPGSSLPLPSPPVFAASFVLPWHVLRQRASPKFRGTLRTQIRGPRPPAGDHIAELAPGKCLVFPFSSGFLVSSVPTSDIAHLRLAPLQDCVPQCW
jgi:hypothetical protein